MMRRRRVAVVTVVLAALLLGGFALVQSEARARVAAVDEQAARVADTQSSAVQYYQDLWTQPQVRRMLVTESMLNDTMPVIAVEGQGSTYSATYGAFGGASFGAAFLRPWSLPLSTIPFGAAGVLAITATLIAASRWTPRRR